jgi:invasion protein IalB
MKSFGFLAACLLTAAGLAAATAEPRHPETPASEVLGTVGAWSAYESRDATGRVCYLAGEAAKSEGTAGGQRQPMAMVTHRPAEHITNVVSFVEGRPLKPGSNVALDIDGRKFSLFVKGDSAWAPTSELDRTITTALSRGRSAIATGESATGRRTTDVYALDGFAKALALIDKACGLTSEESVLSPPVVRTAPARHRDLAKPVPHRPPARAPVHKHPAPKKPVHKKPLHKPATHPENPSAAPTQMAPHPSD